MKISIAILLAFSGLVFPPPPVAAQEDINGAQALRVFLDCNRGCDFDFLRREVIYVNYVRNPQDAQVHVLVTRERAGAGREYTLNFIGMGTFEGVDHKLLYLSSDIDTDDEQRRGFARIFQLGLVEYVLATPIADGLQVSFLVPEGEGTVAATPEDDPWNAWLFRIGTRGNLNREERQDAQSFSGFLNAGRVTEKWRVRMGSNFNYRETNFEFEDGSTLKNVRRNVQVGGQVIKSLGPHWGAGVGVSARRSTFLNLDFSYRAAASVEYNLFPYSESSERSLTFAYFLGANRLNYQELTIFGELEETRPNHGVNVSLEVEQPWGDADVSIRTSQFLDDLDQYAVELFGNFDYRIFRGLSVSVFGSASLIRNQIYLPAAGATNEEILLELQALATDSRFRVGLGLNYTFGSIYNNVVNSRLSSGNGFTTIF